MISNFSQESWDQKVIELGGSILQSWAWGEFQQSLNQKIYRFSGNDFVNLAIQTSLPFGKKYLYCPRGPLGNINEALSDLKAMESDRNLIFSRIEPMQAVDLPRAVKDTQPVDNWALDLEKTEEELLIGMKPKTRYNINLAQRKGVMVKEGDQKDLLSVWQLLLETSQKGGFMLHPQNYYLQMHDYLSPRYLKILIAEYNGLALACMILTLFGSSAVYLHGGTSSKMKEAMAAYLLHWEAIRLAKKSGMKFYDFGGISVANPSWFGITRFKKSFGGFEVKYPGSFDLIYSPIWYNAYKHGRKLGRIFR